MAATVPLTGSELIDCARANAKFGLSTTCERCGYGGNTEAFLTRLRGACAAIGIEIETLADLDPDRRRAGASEGIEIGPDTPTSL